VRRAEVAAPMARSRNLFWVLTALVAIVLATVFGLVVSGVDDSQTAVSPTKAGTAAQGPTDSNALVERGRYLAVAANCASCHTRPGGAPFSGGVAFETPFGLIYSSNITADIQHGIGNWKLEDLRRALHEGISAKGYRLFPAFPYTSFTRITDQDVSAIYAYLRTVAADAYSPPANGALFKQRWAMAVWNRLFFRPGRFRPDPTQSAEWNTGAYFVGALGHCDACHSPRNLFMAETQTRAYQGGSIREHVDAGRTRSWSAVNLTASAAGLKSWSVDNLAKYLHTGFSPRAGAFGPMNEVIANSTANLTTEDVHAMATYIKSLPEGGEASTPVSPELMAAGETIYRDRCQKCHGASGRGGMFSGPPLAGSAIVQAQDPSSLINAILYGAEPPKGISLGAWETMRPYADVLGDAQIAALANYLRGTWGHHASRVDAAMVGKQR
jgi:alcohol dehydrogenase (quinone), cytochrome c subunit